MIKINVFWLFLFGSMSLLVASLARAAASSARLPTCTQPPSVPKWDLLAHLSVRMYRSPGTW